MRPRPTHLLLLAALVVASNAIAAPTHSTLSRGLDAFESGAPIPLTHRPLTPMVRLLDRVNARSARSAVYHVPAEYVAPAEFGVTFAYDGPRSALEAAGIRVQSQVGNFFTARVRRDEVANLRAMPGLRSVQLARYLQKHLNVSIPDVRADLEHGATGTPPVYTGRAGAGILVGDVDSGVDFANADFKGADGKTRILYIWDQNTTGTPPSGFTYGTEWTKTQIDNTPASVTETDTDGHGTNVAGVLVGNGSTTGCSLAAYRYVGVAPEANFVEVATDFSDAGIVDGVNYIFQKAAALGMDCVVNLSLGSQFSPHDGSDGFSQAISALTGPGKVVVASAGNDQLDYVHGKLTTTSTTVGTDKFTMNVPTYTANAGAFNDYVLVTGWYDPSASLTIRVKGPTAADTLSCGFGNVAEKLLTVSAGKGGKIWIVNDNASQGYGGTATLRQFEVEVYDSLASNAPRSGTWEIDCVANGAGSIGSRVDVWIYASQIGALGAAPTILTNRDLTTMIGDPADGDSVIAVGAHATKASWHSCLQNANYSYGSPPTIGDIAYFSNVGPRRDGKLKPELTAPGFGVATTHSSAATLATGWDVDDGVHELTQGTSFSAPHVSGAVALFFQYQPHATPSKVRQTFEQHARADSYTGTLPNATWGYGKLDIYATIDHVAPTCAVTSPAGGESWAQNTTHNVTWNASDNVAVTTVDVAYSKHGAGGPWVAIATGVANSGSMSWTLPAGASDSALVRVTAHDAGNNATAGTSATFFHVTASTGVGAAGPAVFFLAPPAPNPSAHTVSLRFSLARTGHAAVGVFGVHGERVWSQSQDGLAAGPHEVVWDGRTNAGRRAGTGLYFVRLTTADGTRTQRLVRLD